MSPSANKVLIVEDSRAINEMLVHSIVTQLHIDVESARSMKEAREIVRSQKDSFFVSILDINLPDAPNGEIVDYILEQNIPPIILTGNISDDIHDEMMEKPIIDYVVKRNLNEVIYIIDTIRRLRDNINRKILVVDDSRSSRRLITSLLNRHYFNVTAVSNAADALKLLDEHDDFTMVITDYNMPNMNGMELVAKIREKYSRNELSIIGISASGTGTISIRLLKSGANDFIARPFMHEEFYCRVNQNIDAVINYRKLKHAADRDFLTDLFNRKYLFNTGQKLFENAKRHNFQLTVAMLDIDYFKKINDTYGHHIGDMALKHIASLLSMQLRETDIIARIGGEEFCLLCVNTGSDTTEALLERYRSTIEDNPLITDDFNISISISIGYTTKAESSLEQMINDADSALYKAKESGRNRVVAFSEQ